MTDPVIQPVATATAQPVAPATAQPVAPATAQPTPIAATAQPVATQSAPVAPAVDFSFSGALEQFKEQGKAEVNVMQRQPLQYLKSGDVHRLRIVPGVKNPVEWFMSIKRHYFGNATVAPLRRPGGRFSCICSASVNNQPCFSDAIQAYLEATGSAISGEFIPRDAALVNAYRANEADPQLFPFLMTKTNIGQLVDLWKEGYVFFHPVQGFAVTFKPVEGMSLFTVTPDAMKQSALPPEIMDTAKPLFEVAESLLIPYDTLKSWFTDPLVRAVDHFVKTGEASPIELNQRPVVQQPVVQQPVVTQPTVTQPTVTQPTVTQPTVTQPAVPEELSFVPGTPAAPTVTPTVTPTAPVGGQANVGFLDQLKDKMDKLQGQQ